MIIALLSGHPVANKKTFHAIVFDLLVSEVLPSILGGIDIGNDLYQYQNEHGFLQFIVGLEILPDKFLVSVMGKNLTLS